MQENEVTQADREAAGALARFLGESENQVGRFIAGELDHTDIVQAFVRHRQQAEDAMQERCSRIANAEALRLDQTAAWRVSAKTIATAIRAATLSKEGEA